MTVRRPPPWGNESNALHLGIMEAERIRPVPVELAEAMLADNLRAFVDAVAKAQPVGARGTYFKQIERTPIMGRARLWMSRVRLGRQPDGTAHAARFAQYPDAEAVRSLA
jgi:hypothetical protein